MYIYIPTYICIHICVYIYIYINMQPTKYVALSYVQELTRLSHDSHDSSSCNITL